MARDFEPASVEAFHYLGWDYDRGRFVARYALDGLSFEERYDFPGPDRIAVTPGFERALTMLFVAAGTSYFKLASPPTVTGLPAGSEPYADALFHHGLAEFAMTNGLDPIRPAFTAGVGSLPNPTASASDAPALVAVGGGKDSIVTIESVRRAQRAAVLGSVRTHRAIADTARLSGLEHLVVDRRIDPQVLELNACGALNGHVPVTAINSWALVALAAGLGLGAVVMSNESSASVPITSHRGQPVNHQWSKSLDAERALAGLAPVPYFSLLRPLHEVEICRRFAGLTDYFGVVTSCNQAYTAQGRAADIRWCGQCPKCRFVFLGLAPFLTPAVLVGIFDGLDLLDDETAVAAYRAILGVSGEPPMECVGTTRESRWAMLRLAEDARWRHHAVVRALAAEIDVVAGWDPLVERGPHAIPEQWLEVLDALA